MITGDNFDSLVKKKIGKKVPPPKNMRAKGRPRDAIEVSIGNYKILFVIFILSKNLIKIY